MFIINADTIKSMVCRTLADNFKDHKVYKNKVKQGVKLPCFFVTQLDPIMEKVTRDKSKRNLIINIRYECENQNYSKNDEMAFNLMDIFERTTYENEIYIPIKITQNNSDGIMQILIYYEIFLIREKKKLPLTNLNTQGGLKDGRRNI